MKAELPEPSPDAAASSAELTRIIKAEIEATGGWISFARYMELALYAPGLGYYAGGSQKFGSDGDFTTAPELTPLFGQSLARQIAQITATSAPLVMEAGAGSGRLAADLLPALDALGALPDRYQILELSGELRARQRATLTAHAPAYFDRVVWLDELPETFSGCLIGNEVLDAMPTHAVHWTPDGLLEGGVSVIDGILTSTDRPAGPGLIDAATGISVEPPYRGEISLAIRAWMVEIGRRLEHGALLLIDYGLPRRELYLPQRNGGTVRCHYRHRAHDEPFWFPGLSDITSHVDFTAVAEAGFDAGLSVLGYTSQATFLMNCGIGELLQAKVGAGGTATEAGLKAQGAASLLLSPNEMGELFKVIALGKGTPPLLGFVRGDRTHAL